MNKLNKNKICLETFFTLITVPTALLLCTKEMHIKKVWWSFRQNRDVSAKIIQTDFFFAAGRTAFEKLTDFDYPGESYYTIRNLSLYECQGWCREEPECVAASFSFAVNNAGPEPR